MSIVFFVRFYGIIVIANRLNAFIMKSTYALIVKLLGVILIVFSSNLMLAQVGIGTTTISAKEDNSL